ncbi:PTS glucitol/sorbitol transporter subunit IIB [Oceanobacillus polygoni]|uniref:PTS system glucitol/sorbitol-specific IIC component n=1 Tax=Oceanobacillus polygoni TaxID=1235259 RepID=A0A9X0YRX1_9BACI|nr:PTS glucitol/sorbitol transporter subunit IIB [Oceanobacillus polygoni]MBP2076109.1 PTS system glucitol/sorbitol-specific IIC component [Oceanobacillus polygoni]
MANHKTVIVSKGKNGWGGPLELTPTEEKKYVISVTGGGIHPVAREIARLSGAEVVDSFKNPVAKEQTLVAVIDCGGTARCGTYPRLRIPTVNVKVMSPSGPLAKFMTEDIFASGVTVGDIELVDSEAAVAAAQKTEADEAVVKNNEKIKETVAAKAEAVEDNSENNGYGEKKGVMGIIDKIAKGAGTFMNIMYQAGRDTIDTIIKNIIPFMAFVATLIGIINYTGIGEILANVLVPLSNNIGGLIILGVITSLPFLSPLLAPGAVIGAIIGTLVGNEIANGNIDMSIALPALFAINAQVGTDFIPVGLTLGEAKPETISVGAPAILFSRVITGPLAVVIAYFMSFTL